MEAESRIAIESDADVVTARQRARELAGELELSSTDQTLLATAISEVARNITTYAIRGEVTLRVVHDGNGRSGIEVVARRPRAGHRGHRARAAGRLHHRRGTWARAAGSAPAGRRVRDRERTAAGHDGAARQMVPGRRAGRACVASSRGPPSSSAGRRARRSRARSARATSRSGCPTRAARWSPPSTASATAAPPPTRPRPPPSSSTATPARSRRRCCATATRRCARRAASWPRIAWFDLETAGLTWTGIGNVEGRLVRADRDRGDSLDSPTLFGGVLGWSLPGVKLVRTTLAPATAWSWPPTAWPPTSAPR